MTGSGPLLEVDRVSLSFGGLKVLTQVSFTVDRGEVLSLIGPNGAGKTTLLNIISGGLAPASGRVVFAGVPIQGKASHDVNRRGVGRTFQAVELFEHLTVRENVMVGGVNGSGVGLLACFNRWGKARRRREALAHAADEALAFVGLAGREELPASGLPAGQQRLLAIARIMTTGAHLLLLDEPGAGLNDAEKSALVDVIGRLAASGRTVVLVEHDMDVVAKVSDRVVVLDQGGIIADAAPEAVWREPRVIDAYLGGAVEPAPVAPAMPARAGGEPKTLLRVRDLDVHYGGVAALDRVSLEVRRGEIIAIVGANGAGKSTLLKAIAGIARPERGEITFLDKSVVAARADDIVRRGISFTPEGRQLFPSLSVVDNLMMGSYAPLKGEGGLLRLLVLGAARRADLERRVGEVYALFPVLAERHDQLAGTLSGGQGQMLAIGRSLMSAPTLLMLDEPSLGLAPRITEQIMRSLLRLRAEGMTMLLVEQNARAALQIADRAYVLSAGRVVADGDADDILAGQDLAGAYLSGGEKPPDPSASHVTREAAG